MHQYTMFDAGGVEIHAYKRSKQCRRCQRYTTLLKDFNALNAMYVEDVEDGVCGFYATLHTEYSYSFTHVKGVKGVKYCVLYSVYRAPCSSWREDLYSLLSCGFTSQSEEVALLTCLDLSTTRVIAGKMHSQSLILKTKGTLSNPVFLTYLWKQSCILHTLNKLPA